MRAYCNRMRASSGANTSERNFTMRKRLILIGLTLWLALILAAVIGFFSRGGFSALTNSTALMPTQLQSTDAPVPETSIPEPEPEETTGPTEPEETTASTEAEDTVPASEPEKEAGSEQTLPPPEEEVPPPEETTAPTEPAQQPGEKDAPASFTACEMTTDAGVTLRYWLYTPSNPTDYMPLIVYLHGGSGKGNDLNLITSVDGFPKYLQSGALGDVRAYVVIP